MYDISIIIYIYIYVYIIYNITLLYDFYMHIALFPILVNQDPLAQLPSVLQSQSIRQVGDAPKKCIEFCCFI